MATPKGRVLIVEDEPTSARILEIRLGELGYEITAIVKSGVDAMSAVERDSPDLVCMDIMIKGSMDGIETAALIVKRFALPVVFITAFEDDELFERAKAAAPLGYIIKPFNVQELRRVVEMAIYRHGVEAELKRRLDEVGRMNKLMIGRELKMNEMKLEIEGLRRRIAELEEE